LQLKLAGGAKVRKFLNCEPTRPSGVVIHDEGYNPRIMRTVSIPERAQSPAPLRSKRLLALASDERLVQQIRRRNEAAFEVAFERYAQPILSFCRHMLGSPEEAEDAVQHTFAAAYSDLLRDEREIRLKPWLFTIARNRCLSLLRARREQPVEEQEIPTAGLDQQVERRAELRELLADVRRLPHEQRAALLLAELGDLSHADVARVLGCEAPRVKALVFRARSGLIERRDARETPCDEIREQLANLRGGALRRSELRHHLRACTGCSEYRDQVRRQRAMLATALPVTPSLGLKSTVLGAIGLGGGGSAGGGALAGGAVASAPLAGAGPVAKIAAVALLAGGGGVVGQAASGDDDSASPKPLPAARAPLGAPARAQAAPADHGVAVRPRGQERGTLPGHAPSGGARKPTNSHQPRGREGKRRMPEQAARPDRVEGRQQQPSRPERPLARPQAAPRRGTGAAEEKARPVTPKAQPKPPPPAADRGLATRDKLKLAP